MDTIFHVVSGLHWRPTLEQPEWELDGELNSEVTRSAKSSFCTEWRSAKAFMRYMETTTS